MGGSGGGHYTGPTSDALQKKIDQARERERQRLDADVNELLQRLLAHFNDRDIEAISNHLASLREILVDVAEIDTILLGGSVGKHTAVSGLSDVDALVILDRSELAGKSPQFLLNSFHKQLNQSLPRSEVESIEKGRLAVTVSYHDGTEIQLLPGLRSRQEISIASADGKGWIDTKPKGFQRELTRAKRQLNQSLIPAIKLMKSIVSDFPKQKQLTGYHIEAIALNAAKDYQGAKTPRAFLLYLLGHSADRVLKPIADVTGQSRHVDSYLGKANSIERRNISQVLTGMKRRLEAATTVSQWRAVFEG